MAGMLGARVMVSMQSGLWTTPAWSFIADAAGAALLVLALPLLRKPLPKLLFLGLGAIALHAAGEHAATHGTYFRLAHIGNTADATFVSSSVITPQLLWLPFYFVFLWALLWLFEHRTTRLQFRTRTRLLAGAAIVLVYGMATPSLTLPANNVLTATLTQVPITVWRMALRPPAGSPAEESTELPEEVPPDFFQLARGENVAVTPRPNVLVLLVEGLSAAHLPGVAAYHGFEPVGDLPEVQQTLAGYDFRVYRNMLSMQRQTNRGTYILLCGEYPRVVTDTPKMSEVAAGEAQPRCLPELLAESGYYSLYLQAAPLEFMDKGRFMERIGFNEVRGEDAFGDPDSFEGWGPDDEIYYPEVGARLQALDERVRPWFAVTPNVGTHHPYSGVEDEDYEVVNGDDDAPLGAGDRQETRQRAFATMADELSDLLRSLDEADILDNTLVIIASDETGAFLRRGDTAGVLDGNFGMLAVRPPRELALSRFLERDALVAHMDVPITILDVAGAEAAENMIGRSLLVQEQRRRGLLLGDTYAGRTFFIREDGKLLACDEALLQCESWRFDPQRVFGSLEPSSAAAFLDLEDRRSLVERAAVVQPGSTDPDGRSVDIEEPLAE